MLTPYTKEWIAPGPEIMELPVHLDHSTAPAFAEDAMLCIMSGAYEMILDAAHVTSMTGAGLRAFLAVAKALHVRSGSLAIRNMKPQVKEMFDAAGYNFVMRDEGMVETDAFEAPTPFRIHAA